MTNARKAPRIQERDEVLADNQQRRQGSLPVTRLDDGYVSLKIPEQDYAILTRLFPELKAKDPVVRLAAWKNLEASELGDKYRVTERSPNQVRRATALGNKGIIVK